MFLLLYSINWPNFIAGLLYFLRLNIMSIAIICFSGCSFIKFEINLISLTKPFFYLTKKSRQKFKYLENESFKGEIKSIFYQFKRVFICPKLSLTWECFFKLNLLSHPSGGRFLAESIQFLQRKTTFKIIRISVVITCKSILRRALVFLNGVLTVAKLNLHHLP